MNAWSVFQGDIKLVHLEALKAADALFMELDDDTDCHGAVREFHEQHPEFGRPARGWWRNQAYQHSWIELGDDVVLDIYPIGQVRPLLIVLGYGTMRSLYTETYDAKTCHCRSHFDRTGEHVEDCPLTEEQDDPSTICPHRQLTRTAKLPIGACTHPARKGSYCDHIDREAACPVRKANSEEPA